MKREHKGRSLLEFHDSYVVIDIETTGLDPQCDEIIEVGAIKVVSGEIVDSFSCLVKPKTSYLNFDDDGNEIKLYDSLGNEIKDYIDDFITSLTGITNEMLNKAQEIELVLPSYLEFLGDNILIGHNVNFDINFLYDATKQYTDHFLTNDFVDTMRLAKWYLLQELESHRLDALASYYSCSSIPEHRALKDCTTTDLCYKGLLHTAIEKYGDLTEFNNYIKERRKHSSRSANANANTIITSNTTFNEEHPLYKKVCVITGKLDRMVRTEAMQKIVDIGGINANNITSKTNYLILGNNDYNPTIKDGKSIKQKKAEQMILDGKDVAILSENVFYDMLESSENNY